MENLPNTSVLLFSYGTLQDKAVQLANFGRELSGRPDAIVGYTQTLIAIDNPKVVATSGKTHHPVVQPSSNPADEVRGTVFEVTVQELAAADEYEVSEYKRVLVLLRSGARAQCLENAALDGADRHAGGEIPATAIDVRLVPFQSGGPPAAAIVCVP
jgi:ribosomal protein S10